VDVDVDGAVGQAGLDGAAGTVVAEHGLAAEVVGLAAHELELPRRELTEVPRQPPAHLMMS
jgi:hypothetical protein